MVGAGNTYRRSGELDLQVRTPLGEGEGDAMAELSAIAALVSDLHIDDVRLHQPIIGAGTVTSGWWSNSIIVPFDFDEVITLARGLPGTVTSVEDVRSIVRQKADSILSVPTQFDNSLFTPPSNGVWARVTTLSTNQTRISAGVYRVDGLAEVALFTPLGDGDGEVLAIADQVIRGFLPATHSGVTLRAPYVTTLGRSGAWWQISVSCPFFAEI